MIKPNIIVLSLSLISLSVNATETAICRGTNWSYKFSFISGKCEHEQKVHTEFPGHKKGLISKFIGRDQLSESECWKSLAKIQMGGASCCWKDGSEVDSCSLKKVTY